MNDNFWGRVLDLMERKNISRKEFAQNVGISYSSIHNGSERNSIPSADIALRIADELGTSIEYLVYGNAKIQARTPKTKDITLYRKNKETIDALEVLPSAVQNSIRDMICKISRSYRGTA